MELAMARVISALTGDGITHSIACLKGGPDISDRLPKATRIYCFNARPNEPQLPFRLGRLIRKIRPDVIHARNWGAWPDVAVGRFLAYPCPPLNFQFSRVGKGRVYAMEKAVGIQNISIFNVVPVYGQPAVQRYAGSPLGVAGNAHQSDSQRCG